MNDILYNYMTKRFSDNNQLGANLSAGPVLTISRAAGCSANRLALDIASKLSDGKKRKWEVISKEILQNSAEIMKLQPDRIKSVFKPKNRSMLDEIVQAFISGDYHLEKRMIKTVTNVIHNFGIDGHSIIIGRASNIICADIPNSLHIRIDAPLCWRISKLEHKKNISKEEALVYINETEKNRESFKKTIMGDINKDNFFDLIINQSKFSREQIISIIIDAMKIRNLI